MAFGNLGHYLYSIISIFVQMSDVFLFIRGNVQYLTRYSTHRGRASVLSNQERPNFRKATKIQGMEGYYGFIIPPKR